VFSLVLLAVVSSAVFFVATNRPATPSPSASPASAAPSEPIQGSLCFSTQPLTSCVGSPSRPAFHPGQTINFFVDRPFYADDVVRVIVSRGEGAASVVLSEADYQVIPNPFGMFNTIARASDLIASIPTGSPATYCIVDAFMGGNPIAHGGFDLYPNSDPS
jgi:hypothetical protein